MENCNFRLIKNNRLLVCLSTIFLCIESALGTLLQTAKNADTVNYHYMVVLLACAFCILFAEKTLSYAFTQIALVFTIFADYYLVYLTEIKQLPAMLCFSVVQIAYFLRLYFEDSNLKRRKVHLIVRVVGAIVAVAVSFVVMGKNLDPVVPVTLFYYANLLLNVVFAFINAQGNWIFPIGLLLFLLCDTSIGLNLLKNYFPIENSSLISKIVYPGFDLVWAFYTPSQALLAVSLLMKRFKKENKEDNSDGDNDPSL